MADLPREPRFDITKVHQSLDPFREVNELYGREVEGLIKILFDESLSESIRLAIRKYLTVTIFAALDYFFRNSVRILVDKNDLNVDSLFPAKSKLRLEKKMRENNSTKGTIVASTYRFVDIYEIDFVFSNLFQMDSFLDYLIKQNDIDQTRFVLDGHPIPIEYHKLTQAYKLRNDIAHEVTKARISKSNVIAMWDNLMNVMDLSRSFFYSISHPDDRESLDSRYQQGKNRAIRKARYKLCCDTILSKLLENKQLGRTCQRQSLIDEIKLNSDKIVIENVDRVISAMLSEGLVFGVRNGIELTLKGQKRFKRTTKSERNKWKREISEIVCSWLLKERGKCTT